VKTTGYRDFVHTGPGTLAGRFMRRFWHPVYRAEDLPAGTAVPLQIMSESFTLYRAESGAPHIVGFRCAHRGTQLSPGWVEGDDIRCFYHGWKYNPSGECVEQPAEPKPFCEKIKIRSCPTHEYVGCIWAYFGAGEPPPPPRYPELEKPGLLEVVTYIWPFNYFQIIENAVDQSHQPFVHRDSTYSAAGIANLIPIMTGEETEYGLRVNGTRPGGAVRQNHLYMPNQVQLKQHIENSGGRWKDLLAVEVPVDDEHCRHFAITLLPFVGDEARAYQEQRPAREAAMASVNGFGDAVLQGSLRKEDVPLRGTYKINFQDYVAHLSQGTIADRTQERLGQSDAVVILLRKIWARELRALAEGRPLKEWARPEQGVASTTGVGR
jgi:5,5'-dehydrodivanillate O-demethylase